MSRKKDLSRLFAKGQLLESSLTTTGMFRKDGGLHLTSYKVEALNKTTVIDNLIVYGSTVLVIESKNYKEIIGDFSDGFWKGRGSRKFFSILNPIKQNMYHAKVLTQYLSTKDLSPNEYLIKNVVVVPDTCQVFVCEDSKMYLIHQSQMETEKRKLAFYNPTLNEKLVGAIKEGLF